MSMNPQIAKRQVSTINKNEVYLETKSYSNIKPIGDNFTTKFESAKFSKKIVKELNCYR